MYNWLTYSSIITISIENHSNTFTHPLKTSGHKLKSKTSRNQQGTTSNTFNKWQKHNRDKPTNAQIYDSCQLQWLTLFCQTICCVRNTLLAQLFRLVSILWDILFPFYLFFCSFMAFNVNYLPFQFLSITQQIMKKFKSVYTTALLLAAFYKFL